jgi:hypothetical protein
MMLNTTAEYCHHLQCDYRHSLDWWMHLLTTYIHMAQNYKQLQ